MTDGVVVVSYGGVQVLECEDGHQWARQAAPGRAPKLCPSHRAGSKWRPPADGTKRKRAVVLAEAGLSLRKIGSVLGVSGECVRLWLDAAGFTSEMRSQAKQRVKESLREDELRERLASAKPCVVCDQPVVRGRRAGTRITCSSECAEAWTDLRVHTPEGRDKHRLAVAKSTLRHPEGKRPSLVAWAEALVAGRAAPPRRAWYVGGSRADEAAQKFWNGKQGGER